MGGMQFEHAQNIMLQRILVANERLKQGGPTTATTTKSGSSSDNEALQLAMQRKFAAWMELQDAVNTLMDVTKARAAGLSSHTGVKQTLEKKEGLFRRNMMGKEWSVYGGEI